jgi:hypothetical protein
MPGNSIDVLNCTIEILQSLLLKIGYLITNANIDSSAGCSIPLRTFVWLSEMAIPSAGDSSSGVNHAAISKLEPHQFANHTEKWYENGVSIELYPRLVPQDFQSGWQGLPRLMNGAPVDMYTEQMLECVRTFLAFPPADIEPAPQAIKKIIDRFVMDNNPHTQDLGPYWAVARLQRVKFILQNWAFDDSNQIFIR